MRSVQEYYGYDWSIIVGGYTVRGISRRRVYRTEQQAILLSDQIRTRILHDFIESGKVSPLSSLPSEKELGERYGVSRVTIRAAIRSLRDQGMLSVRNGVGAVVLPPIIHQAQPPMVTYDMDRLASIDTFAIEAGGDWNIDAAAEHAFAIAAGSPSDERLERFGHARDARELLAGEISLQDTAADDALER